MKHQMAACINTVINKI